MKGPGGKRKLVPGALCRIGYHRLVLPPLEVLSTFPVRFCARKDCEYEKPLSEKELKELLPSLKSLKKPLQEED